MVNHIGVMKIRSVPAENQFQSDILTLFEEVDKTATGDHYETSTADVSRTMFLTEDADVTDRTALLCFYETLTDYAILAFEDEVLVGFTLIAQNDSLFTELLPEKTPHIAIHFSAVHPDHQRNGVWTTLRNYVETTLCQKHEAKYIVTAASQENDASQSANESRGLTECQSFDSEFENSETILYAKSLD